MATLRAFDAFDMGDVLGAGRVTAVSDSIRCVSGTARTVLTGDFSVDASGVHGSVLGFSVTLAGRTVFEAIGLQRSAATVLAIVQAHDNDRLLAYTLSGDDRIVGSGLGDTLIGFGGADTLVGGAGRDRLFGGSDADALVGGAGADFLAGGLGADLLRGGQGDDTYLVGDARDQVIEVAGQGEDSILSSVSLTLAANVERLVLIGSGRIAGRGNAAANVIDGNDAANVLVGNGGCDRLDGDGGNDVLIGGIGRDELVGGGGRDTFRFRSAAEANGDRILDFARGDRVDLAGIDADPGRGGDQACRLLHASEFDGHAGALVQRGAWLFGDLDGDRFADFGLRVGISLTGSDLLL